VATLFPAQLDELKHGMNEDRIPVIRIASLISFPMRHLAGIILLVAHSN
jgi:hypothetical protein